MVIPFLANQDLTPISHLSWTKKRADKEGFRRPNFGRVEFKSFSFSSTKMQHKCGSHFISAFNVASDSILSKLT